MWIDIQGTILVFWWLRESFQPTGDCKRYHLFQILTIHLKKANKIVGCEMARQFDLPFDFESGSCNTCHVSEEKVLMCFSGNDPNTCHM